MNYQPEIGVSAKELGWVPSPTFILRRAAILDIIQDWKIGSVIEVGCGAGSISYELSRQGFNCTAVETSERALTLAQKILKSSDRIIVSDTLPSDVLYDYLVSFEVLEHIEDDAKALRSWLKRLKRGGRCLISVPSHKEKWNVTDIAAGHYRRYDRNDIQKLAEDCGLEDIEITTYGWPFSFVIEKLRNQVKIRQLKKQGIEPEKISVGDAQYTMASGINRDIESRLFPIYGSWLGRKFFSLAAQLQRPFFQSNLGVSFMVSARKPDAS